MYNTCILFWTSTFHDYFKFSGLDDQENKYVCYDCTESFRTQMALQKHIMIHEINTSSNLKESSKTYSYTATEPEEQYLTEAVTESEASTSGLDKAKKTKPPKKAKVRNQSKLCVLILGNFRQL